MLIAEVSCIIFVLWLTPFQEVRKHTDLEQQAQVNEYIWMVTWNCDPILTSWGRKGNPLGSRSYRACSWLGGTKVNGISIPLLHKTAESGSIQNTEIYGPSRICWGNEWPKSWDNSSPFAIWGSNSYRLMTASHLLCVVPGLTGAIMAIWHDSHNIVSFGLQAQTMWEPTMRAEKKIFSGQFPGPG